MTLSPRTTTTETDHDLDERLLARTRADTLYGTDDSRTRAAHWAIDRGLRRSTSFWPCAHGLLRRGRNWPCGCGHARVLDHPSLWVRAGLPVLLLSHLYPYETPDALVVDDPEDAWYGFETTPVRFGVRS